MKDFFQQKSLILGMAVSMILAAFDAPLWVGFFSGFVFLWKLAAEKNYVPKLARRWTAFLSILLLIQVGFQYRTLFNQEASSTFLLGLCALKIMDYESRRDHHFLVLLGFILVSVKPIFSLDVYWLLPSFFAFIAFWISMLPSDFEQKGRFLAKMSLMSIPAGILLFFAFPRVLVPWAQSRVEPKTNVGFSDQLNPGRVAELANLDAPAFRAKFLTRNPRAHELYWRGSVLTVSEGLKWLAQKPKVVEAEKNLSMNQIQTYDVVLEPSAKMFLFTLATPTQVVSNSFTAIPSRFGTFRNTVRPESSLSYRATSDPSLVDREGDDPLFLQTPPLGPKTLAWVEDVKRKEKTTEARLQALNGFFQDPRFVYTLKPGVYDKKDLDSFLFEKKRGFCEHFAGAYATLARALNVPSRIVVGYQGGSYNPIGDFWRVSQRDAHAWTEIFSGGQWRRVDPTDWIAPLRLSLGAEAFFELPEDQQLLFGRSPGWNPDKKAYREWWDQVVYTFEALNYRWMGFLLDFDRDSQKDFWRNVSQNLSWTFGTLALFTILFFFARKLVFNVRSNTTEMESLILEIFAWGDKQGHPRGLAEPPLSYLKNLGFFFPEKSESFRKISQAYTDLIYRMQEPTFSMKDLRQQWRRS